jgi:hypothetical protein
MSNQESHSVRNGVIATVIGSITMAALGEMWPPAKKAGIWLWDKISWLASLFVDMYYLQGWLLALLLLLSLVTVIRFLVSLKGQKVPAFPSYVEDQLFGAKWRWSWIAGEVSNLWAFCPRCDSELVYDDSSCNSLYYDTPAKTDFICEHCHRDTVASVPGGNKSYAISVVQREIRRRIRTNEYKSVVQPEA